MYMFTVSLGWALDLQSRGRRFDSWSVRDRVMILARLVVSLSPSSIIWYQSMGSDALQLGSNKVKVWRRLAVRYRVHWSTHLPAESLEKEDLCSNILCLSVCELLNRLYMVQMLAAVFCLLESANCSPQKYHKCYIPVAASDLFKVLW